jgi:O-antigen/teichoic acid export membrane protein
VRESRFRPILVLLTGNLLGAAVGGIFFLLASRRFSIDEMGRYTIAISAQFVTFGLIGTGLSIATLRLTRDRLAAGDRPGAAGTIANALTGITLMALVLSIASFFVLGLAPTQFALVPVLAVLAILWAGARGLLDILRSGLLAQQDFSRTAILTILSAASGLIALTVVMASGEFTVRRLLIAHVLGLFGGALLSVPLLVPLTREGIRRGSAWPLIDYARWPAASEGTRLLQGNLGALILAALAGPTQAGLFGLGRYPAYVFDVVAVTLYQFWLAKAVHVPERAAMRGYLVRQLQLAGALGLAMVVTALLVQPILPILGENFGRAGSLFVLSSIDFALVLLVRPIESVFHGLRRPRLELLQRALTLPVLLLAAVVLVPRFGAMGMAGAHILASGCSLLFGGLLLHRTLTIEPAS